MVNSKTEKRRAALVPLVFAGAVALSAGGVFMAGAANAADAANGKTLFESKCAVCHKTDASGGINLGDTTSADLQSHGLEDQYHKDDALIKRAILKGLDEEGDQLDSVMPRWGEAGLTSAEADDIIAFLHTVKTTK